jgi:hypothetical protein
MEGAWASSTVNAVLGIRDILVRIRIRTSDYPTRFFSDFKDAKKLIVFVFFSFILPADTLSSV